MNNYLKHHRMRIRVLSPIHIGSGEKLMKKEYIFLPNKSQVIIPDLRKMYAAISAKHLASKYEDYILHNYRDELGRWLQEQGFRINDYMSWKRYVLYAGDLVAEPGRDRAPRPKEIMAFIKDGNGDPFVPGSSIKGMIRTALLSWEIRHHKERYSNELGRVLQNMDRQMNRKRYLNQETSDLEVKAFHSLKNDKKEVSNAVNSNLSGLIISDSKPLSVDQLTLSQKIDISLDRRERALPILKEALKPGTDIEFEVTIDTKTCPYSMDIILEALEDFQQICYSRFHSKFGRGTNKEGIVWLGGGCGFLSKTIIYDVFDEEAVKVADAIFKVSVGKNYYEHKHNKDLQLGVSPHVCKCTRYHGQLYDMGMGLIELIQ